MQARGGAVLARRICDADGLRSYVLPASTTSQPRERAQVLLAAGSPSRWRLVAELVDQAVRRDCAHRESIVIGGDSHQISIIQPFKMLESHRVFFLAGGFAFLLTSLVLYGLVGYMVFRLNDAGPIIQMPESASSAGEVSQRDIYNYYGRILSVALSPLICLTAAFICTFVGIRLPRSSGAVATQVISPQDYPILGPAIAAGKDEV